VLSAQKAANSLPTPAAPWWKGAVIYEVYPRSFQDSNGDGIGDLNGITNRLDYIQSLGVDAIWLTPIYPSPQVDFGYDISDYEAIDPQYGTMSDFDRLVREAKKRNIRVLMDLVLNHTSDQHPWFKASASSRTNPKRDWYVWRDGKAPGVPPNNWSSLFGHSAWKYDPTTDQWYYHRYYTQQPDLNWRNPEVKKAMFSAVRFWLDRGVAGFRLDAIGDLYEDARFLDSKVLPGTNRFGDPLLDQTYVCMQPELHDVLRELRQLVDSYPGQRVLVGETWMSSTPALARMYGEHNDELHLPMDFRVGMRDTLDANAIRTRIQEAETGLNGNEPLFVFNNHDGARSWDRFGDGLHNQAIAKVVSTILLATRATALMYYGEELGMATTQPTRVEDVKDPVGIVGWPKDKGRDGERTPMQWNSTPLAGFTTAKPWLPIPLSVASVNVATEQKDQGSMLRWYKQLLALRRSNPALRDGDNTMLDHDKDKVLVWLRHSGPQTVLVLANLSAESKLISVAEDLKSNSYTSSSLKLVLSSSRNTPATLDPSAISLPSYGVILASITENKLKGN
jgi:alpha-glucosidase